MKKEFLLSFCFIFFLISFVSAISNPSATFCEEKGHQYVIKLDSNGNENGYCDIDGELMDGWEYYRENKETNTFSKSFLDNKNDSYRKFLASSNLKEDISPFRENNQESVLKEFDNVRGIPSSFDWRNYNGKDWTTPIRDQGGCGACWAFSSASVVEAKSNINLGNATYNPYISVQDIISNANPTKSNCNGGFEADALSYIKNTGVVKENCMTYTGTNSGTMCSNGPNEKLRITNYVKISPNVNVIKNAISTYGPVTAYMIVCGDFDGLGVNNHAGDVYFDWSCYQDGLDCYSGNCELNWHSISIVGYNSDGWIIKNSWGNTWGSSGFATIAYQDSVYNRGSWISQLLTEDGDDRVLFLDDSYYVTGTDITTNPVVSSFTASTSYNRSDVPISFSINAVPKSLKYFSSVKINDFSMSGNLQTGGTFSLSKTASEFGCVGETTCSLTATATDDAGKIATTSKTIRVDDLAPRVTNFRMNNQSYFVKGSDNLIFGVNVEDANIDSVKLNNIAMSLSGTSYSLTKTPSQLGCSEDGVCIFNITAEDKIGNLNNSIFNFLHIDDIFPVINSISLEKNIAQTGERVSITINATDNNNVSSVTAEGINLEKSIDLWEGNISLKSSPLEIIVTDVAGNILTNNSLIYILDDTPPILISNLTYNSQNVSQDAWHNYDLNLSLNATDVNGVSKIEWRFANQNSWDIYSNPLNFSENIEENKIIFRAIDEVGNIALSKIVDVKIDKIYPLIEKVNLNLNRTNPSGEINLFVNTFDNLSGIKEIKAIFNGVNYTNFEKINKDYQIYLIAPNESGIYSINLSVEDNAGNINTSSIELEVVDNFPLVIPSIPSGNYVGNNTNLTFTLFDVTNGTYNFTGHEQINITNETGAIINIAVNETPCKVIFNVTNGENNSYQEFSYLLDTVSPNFTLNNLPVLYDLNGTYKINFNCSDDSSDVKNIFVYVDGEILKNLSSEATSYDLDTLRLSNSNHTLKFVYYDYSENFNETEINISVNNIPISQTTQKGQVSFETSELGNYVKTITSINSSEVQLSLLVGENILITAPSDVNQKLIYFNITASAQSKSKVYFSLSKDLLSGVDISKLKLWEKHERDISFNGPKSIVLIEERELDYLFYFETESYSEFIIGEQKVSTLPPSSGGGSSGGGGSSRGGSSGGASVKNIFINESQLREIQTISLLKGEKINFRFSNQNNHTLTINNFNNESINLTIASDPINLTLFLGKEIKLNLTSPDYYDLYLKLENITYNKVNLTIQEINESIISEVKEEIEEEIDSEKNQNYSITIICVLGILILLYFGYKFFKEKNNKKKKKSNKKKFSLRGFSKKMKKWIKPIKSGQ